MLNSLIRRFSRQLIISRKHLSNFQDIALFKNQLNVLQLQKNNFSPTLCTNTLKTTNNLTTENLNSSTNNILDSDEYVLPYEVILETQNLQPEIQLNTKLGLKKSTITKLFNNNIKLKQLDRYNLNTLLDIIVQNYIRKESVVENAWILTIDHNILKRKLNILKTINYKDINDVVPLLRLSTKQLIQFSKIMRNEYSIIKPINNRIYYLSEKLKVEPNIISDHLSKRLFMFRVPITTIIESLNCMLEFGIPPNNILRDLWAFRYPTNCIRDRLKRANSLREGKLMPWMIRCTEKILQNSLELSLYEKQLLGEKKSIIDYLSQRLGYDPEITKAIMSRHPAVFKVRIKKVKEVLDYLLNDEKFTPHDIARVPRVLCHKLETTKSRLDELKSHGCTPSSLVIVCRSKREYQKFLRNWISFENKIKGKTTTNNQNSDSNSNSVEEAASSRM